MSTSTVDETAERTKVFAAIGDMLARGYEHHEMSLAGQTIMATVEPDTDARIDDYEPDVYPATRREQWRNDEWRFVVLTVRVFNRPGLQVWDVQGPDGDRWEVGRVSLGSVESDSSADYLAEEIENLYDEATAGKDIHQHQGVAGMMYVNDEDLDTVSAMRPVECEHCDLVYRNGRWRPAG